MGNVIEISNLNKSFGEIRAVRNLSFKVKEGEFFAFLGVNGAGKSTTINIICGMLRKDEGKVLINGMDPDAEPDKVRESIGVVFQNSVLDKDLTVLDNLKSRGALYGIYGKKFRKRLKELSTLLDFEDLLKRPVGKLSGGQRRRIDIARALIHRPEILILDEPTTGLDPQTRRNDRFPNNSLHGRGGGCGLRGHHRQRFHLGGGNPFGFKKSLHRRLYYSLRK